MWREQCLFPQGRRDCLGTIDFICFVALVCLFKGLKNSVLMQAIKDTFEVVYSGRVRYLFRIQLFFFFSLTF